MNLIIGVVLAASWLHSAAAVERLMREGDVPGVSIVVIRNSRIEWHRAFGVANAETRAPLSSRSIFESASLTKPVFAYGVLKLVDAGVLSLDVPLIEYLPEPATDPRMRTITARMVLTHTTGFQNEVMPGQSLRIHFTPGERFSYSGAGYLYLVRVVEHLTGKHLPELMRELVFVPLAMRDTGYVWIPAYERTKVYGHTIGGTVATRRKPAEAALPMMHTTVIDYARFMIAIMNGAGLKPATARAMLTAQVALDEACYNCLERTTGRTSKSLSWGLGWGLQRTERGQAFWHWGDNNGELQHFVIGYPDGDGVIVFTNSGNGLSITPEIVAALLPGSHPAFAWMRYDTYKAPWRQVLRDIMARGANSVLRGNALDALDESQVNRIGYVLLERKRTADAVAIFERNAARFPDSFNAHDSLGEAYAAAGDVANAIASYERSLKLNPKNTNAVQVLETLRRRKLSSAHAPGPSAAM